MRFRKQRRGYVLLVVLAVALLITTALATLAKTSMRRAISATDAARRLQQRWGAETLQESVLRRAPKVFEERDEMLSQQDSDFVPPVVLRDAITLGGVTFDMVIGDEDAKLNLNSIYRAKGESTTKSVLQDFVGTDVARNIRLIPAIDEAILRRMVERLNEESAGGEEPEIPDVFRSWGEVFDLSSLSIAFRSDAALPNVTTEITCWGSGACNIKRASDETLQAIVASVLSETEASRLVRRYRENRTLSVQILAQTEVAQELQRRQLLRMLSQTSQNYSIWIDASTVARRSLRRFTVMQQDDEGVTQFRQFAH